MSQKETAVRMIELLRNASGKIHKDTLMRKLLIGSESTFFRILGIARRLPGITIEAVGKHYRLISDAPDPEANPFLPTDDELISLASLQHILSAMTSDSLRKLHEPLYRRITAYLAKVNSKFSTWHSRIRILDIHHRAIPEGTFGQILVAAVRQHTLRFTYNNSHGIKSDRIISPQQIVRYKDNWYLDAWCHLNSDLRIFSLDNITNVRHINRKFIAPPPELLKKVYATSYGIFSGEPTHLATIRFTGLAARYALREEWHPAQKRTTSPDGSVILEIPYLKPQELIREILARGAEAEVIAPPELREEIIAILARTTALYK